MRGFDTSDVQRTVGPSVRCQMLRPRKQASADVTLLNIKFVSGTICACMKSSTIDFNFFVTVPNVNLNSTLPLLQPNVWRREVAGGFFGQMSSSDWTCTLPFINLQAYSIYYDLQGDLSGTLFFNVRSGIPANVPGTGVGISWFASNAFTWPTFPNPITLPNVNQIVCGIVEAHAMEGGTVTLSSGKKGGAGITWIGGSL